MIRIAACRLTFIILVFVLITLSVTADAQTQTGTTDSPLNIPVNPLAPLPASGTQGGYFFNLRPLGADFGRTLADKGVYIVGRELAIESAAVSGGIKRGAFFDGYTSLGLDLDMQRILGLTGGTLHVLVDDTQGQPNYSYSGSLYAFNRAYTYRPTFRLNELSYEQTLFDNRVTLRFGRVTTGLEFDSSELYCTFISSLCSFPAGYTYDKGYPGNPTSFWGAIAQVKLPRNFYFNTAVFENEPVLSQPAHASFPGPDWGLNYANGATIPAQFGYRTTFREDAYPRTFSIGGFYDTSRYVDPVLNTTNRNRLFFRGIPKMDYGRSQVYVQAQQMVYRPDGSDRGLTLFAGANWATGGQPAITRSAFGGAYYKGLFAARPNDQAGASIIYIGVNPRVTERITSVLSFSKGGQASRSEISYEVYYGFTVAPGVVFKPYAQFISHPDQVTSPKPSGNNTHAMFVGAAFTIFWPETFGLPRLIRQ